MNRDLMATYSLVPHYDRTQRRAVDYLLGGAKPSPELGHLAQVADPMARIGLLAQALVTTSKSYAQSGDRRSGSGGLKQAIRTLDVYFQDQKRDFLEPLGLLPDLPSLHMLPDLSFALHLTFTLRQPYLSQDEADFYIIDNPVRKDKVFKAPYVAPSQWKGALRATMVQQLADWWRGLKEQDRETRARRKEFVTRRLQLVRLFGTEKGVQMDDLKDRRFDAYLDGVGGRDLARWYRRTVRRFFSSSGLCAGWLHFYPTFFTQIGLEIINPHSRESGAGEVPILIESVPAEAKGDFALLYVPRGQNNAQTRQEVAADLRWMAEGLQEMLTVYGFGAKTSSGYGVVRDRLAEQGTLEMHMEDPSHAALQPATPTAPPMPASVREFQAEYPNEDFSLKVQAWRKKHKVGKGIAARYRQAKADWTRYRRALEQFEAEQVVQSVPEEALPAATTRRTFETLSELKSMAATLARELAEEIGGGSV